MTGKGPTPEGRLAVSHGRVRTMRVAVSSSVTASDVAAAGSRLDEAVSLTRRQQLDGLQSALAAMTANLYQQAPVRDAATLDEATRHALSVARDLERERNWWGRLRQGFPLRRGYGGQVSAQGTWWSRR